MAGKKSFPNPADYAPNAGPTICDRDRVLSLYNQAHPNAAMEKVTTKVEKWFLPEAHARGWMYASFVTQTTKHSGGCILISRHGFEYQQEQQSGAVPVAPASSAVRKIPSTSRPATDVVDVDITDEV
jgi:hypothetical protein